MRILTQACFVCLTLFTLIFASSCGDEGSLPGGVTLGPTIQLDGGTDPATGNSFLSFNQDYDPANGAFRVSITVNDGDANLRSLTILENGTNLPTGRIDFDDFTTSNNPLLIENSSFAEGGTIRATIRPQIDQPAGPVTYTFRVTDANRESEETTLTLTYTAVAPTISVIASDNRSTVEGDTILNSNSPAFTTRIRLTATDAPVATLSIFDETELLPASRITFVNPTFTSMNPLTLVEGEQQGATYTIRLNPIVQGEETRTYRFVATDVNGVAGEATITVTYRDIGTPITFTRMGVFFNASGSRFGGLDLDTGDSTRFNSTMAEIQDEGVNLNATPGTENWRRQISPVNDAILRVANLNELADGATFEGISTVEEIQTLYDTGAVPMGRDDFPNTDGDRPGEEMVTEPVSAGDVFAVRRGDRFYVFRIDDVVARANSNNDFYEISIKY